MLIFTSLKVQFSGGTIGQNTVTNNEFPEEEQIGFWQEKHLSRAGTGILTVDPPN